MDKEKCGRPVAVIGSYAVGMTIACSHFPAAGETVPGRDFEMMHGGKGSNQAVAAARLGGNVLFAGCVGRDSFGDMCMDLMKEEGISGNYIVRSETGRSTGVGLIYVNEEGENEIVIDFAANEELSGADIDRMLPALKECSLVLMQLEINMDTVVYTAEKCRELGIPFVLNPAPYRQMPAELAGFCDYLIPNQTEARLMLGLDARSDISDEEAASRIWKMGAGCVIMTLGADGALIVDGNGMTKVDGIRVDAVDTTGAGDTFCGSFCVALSEGKDTREAVSLAVKAAGLSVTKYGVIQSIPYRKDVDSIS